MKNLIASVFKTLFFFDLSIVVISLLPAIQSNNEALCALWREGVPLAVMLVFTGVFILLVEKRRVRLAVTRRKMQNIGRGVSFGFLLCLLPLCGMRLARVFTLGGRNRIDGFFLYVLALLCYTLTQELLLRGYLYQLYRKMAPATVAVTVCTLLFLSMHLKIFSGGPIYTVNLLLLNIVFCLMLEYSKNLLLPITAHFTYNLVSTLLLGSLSQKNQFPFLLNAEFSGKALLSGGAYKLEGSLFLTVTLVLFSSFLILRIRKRTGLRV